VATSPRRDRSRETCTCSCKERVHFEPSCGDTSVLQENFSLNRYTVSIVDFLTRFKSFQDSALHYPAVALSQIGVTPIMVSIGGVVVMIACAFTMRSYPTLSVVLLILSVLADAMDGTLARYQKRSSAGGRIVDVTTDNASFAVFITGLAAGGFVSAPWAATLGILVICSALINTARAFRHAHEAHISGAALRGYWIFPNLAKFLCYPFFAYVALGGQSFLENLVMALSVLIFCEVIYRLMTGRHA